MDARKYALISCILGSTIVWYDFVIFGLATAMVFNKLFFPELGFLVAAMVYAIGFFARPVGSVFFGWLGDRYGRKPTLVASLILTGVVTTAIGLLPTAASIGIAAGIILFGIRILQTAALGGEWAATATIVTEYNLKAQSNNRVFYSSLLAVGLPLASILGGGMFAWMSSYGTEAFLDWGWRVPFLLSFVLLILGVWTRLKVLETPEFVKVKQENKLHSSPFTFLWKNYWRRILLGVGIFQVGVTFYHGTIFFGINYVVNQLGVPRADVMADWFYLTWVCLAVVLFAGWLGDRLGGGGRGGLAIYKIASITALVSVYPIFVWLSQGITFWPLLIGASFVGMITLVACISMFTEMFPTEVRQLGSGLSMSLGAALGGTVPILAGMLLAIDNNIMHAFWVYFASAVLAVTCSFAASRAKVTDQRAPSLA